MSVFYRDPAGRFTNKSKAARVNARKTTKKRRSRNPEASRSKKRTFTGTAGVGGGVSTKGFTVK